MSKKNIQPNSAQPVIRTLVAKAALAELREENLTTDSSSLPAAADKGAGPRALEFSDDGRTAEFLCMSVRTESEFRRGWLGGGNQGKETETRTRRGRWQGDPERVFDSDHGLCSYDGDDE